MFQLNVLRQKHDQGRNTPSLLGSQVPTATSDMFVRPSVILYHIVFLLEYLNCHDHCLHIPTHHLPDLPAAHLYKKTSCWPGREFKSNTTIYYHFRTDSTFNQKPSTKHQDQTYHQSVPNTHRKLQPTSNMGNDDKSSSGNKQSNNNNTQQSSSGQQSSSKHHPLRSNPAQGNKPEIEPSKGKTRYTIKNHEQKR